jgi:threonine dehydratase
LFDPRAGGGGLVAGIAAYVKALKPSIKVFGVEPTGKPATCLTSGLVIIMFDV